MNFLTRFLLSLFLLVWGGDGNLYAFANEAQFSVRTVHQKPLGTRHAVSHSGPVAMPLSMSLEKYHDKIDLPEEDEEEDNDKPISPGKYLQSHNYFTEFCVRASGYFSYYDKHIPFCKHFSHSSSYRCILFCVIRI